MLFSFEQDYSTGNTRILKRLLSENIFLIQKINSKIEVNNWGVYKLYNDSFDFKKIVIKFDMDPINPDFSIGAGFRISK